ncbi:hypothetical protein FG386_001172 [Cryptosporidium ryanae]|uniref:uncharacterized protein n=1 Tax=Cryptosporidium ryanae TaxID=515981 RepID=UPI00351A9ED0|nr:hypothetical protein FG386_001172 [Cryptosporidium ryanae]
MRNESSLKNGYNSEKKYREINESEITEEDVPDFYKETVHFDNTEECKSNELERVNQKRQNYNDNHNHKHDFSLNTEDYDQKQKYRLNNEGSDHLNQSLSDCQDIHS